MIQVTHFSQLVLAALCAFIPISIAGANIFWGIAVLLGCYLLVTSQPHRNSILLIVQKPFSWFLAFFLLLSISVFYSAVGYWEAIRALSKYTEILLMPVLAYVIVRTPEAKRWGLLGFSSAMLLTLLLSYARYFDSVIFTYEVFNQVFPRVGELNNPTIFKLHITHNLFMAFAVLLWTSLAQQAVSQSKWRMVFWLLLALLGAFNVLVMIQGRTGHLALMLALVFFLIQRFRYRGVVYALAVLPLVVICLYSWSVNFHDRIDKAIFEIVNWAQGLQPEHHSSMGVRLDYIMVSLRLALENLWLGTGVGSFGIVYGPFAKMYGLPNTINPHNQYIFFLVELGLVGVVTFILLNLSCWKAAYSLDGFWGSAVRLVILIYGIANFFNSFLYDAAESLFFSVFMAFAFSELLRHQGGRAEV